MQIELVVFDMAGTTVKDDDAVNACFRAAFAEAGFSIAESEINSVMGLAKPHAIKLILERDPGRDATPSAVARIHGSFLDRMISHYERCEGIAEVKGASQAFLRLRVLGIKVALDTGFSRPIARAILERLGWQRSGLIDAVVTSDEVARGRPYPDMIERAMKLTGVRDAARVAKVGDTPADLAEGTAAGCGLVVGVTSGTHSEESLRVHPHTHLIASVAGIPNLVRRAEWLRVNETRASA